MSIDLGEWALETLKATTAVTDLVFAGDAAVLESGELSAKLLEQWQKERRDAVETSKVLAILVMDTGDRKVDKDRQVSCSVFIYDRGGSYDNIRMLREAVLLALLGQPVTLPRDAYVVAVRYDERTGHAIDETFDLDFERVDFYGPLALITPDVY